LKATLFDHQLSGFRWLVRQWDQGAGGLLADDMGLGKTVQVIALLAHLHEQGQLAPTLLVVPLALMDTWREELAKFAPTLPGPYLHLGPGRVRNVEWLQHQPLTLTTYDTLRRDQLLFGKVKYRAIICDEAQTAKAHSSQRSHALRAMQGHLRLAMTGTPVENRLEELWTIMDFVQPGRLGSLKAFRETYGRGQAMPELFEKIRPHYLRRTKEEVLADKLPQKTVQVMYVDSSAEQQAYARAIVTEVHHKRIHPLQALARLRLLYAHPGAVTQRLAGLPPERVPKLEAVLRILDAVRERGEKALIFTESRRVQALLVEALMRRYGVPEVPVINGESTHRQAMVTQFNAAPGFRVCILSPRAAGVGLTLTSANHVIHYTRWWNPAVENQATDRVYRIGQTRPVTVYHVITKDPANFPKGTVEEHIHALLEEKQDLARQVLVPFDVRSVQDQVMRAMFGGEAPSEG
ncbi:DEAD/DEAH box helicase, partial [Alicyclobacillus sp.]|uniref:DEAD/DEAH box helicase n=1 Tax=Alicyclobacillus sp. TaxID=61169 RepID=UPI0025BD979E